MTRTLQLTDRAALISIHALVFVALPLFAISVALGGI